jgi:microcystin-dependent protein
MSEPFLGQISLFGFNFAPRGWATCDGQLMSINQNQALFSLLGTTYGGDGISTFALPDLRGRAGMHVGPSHVLGELDGSESVALLIQEIPAHTHAANCSDAPGTAPAPAGNLWARDSLGNSEYSATAGITLAADAIGPAGGGAVHDNMAPFQVVNFCIALEGIYPSRN